MNKIDLGCGTKKKESYIGIDKFKLKGVDYVLDLEHDSLPFKDNSVEEINASSCLEHIDNFFFIMDECWRVLKPMGRMFIQVPYFRSHWAIAPDHKKFFGVWTWFQFNPKCREKYFCKARFKVVKIRLYWSGKKHIVMFLFEMFINNFQTFYEEFLSSLFPVESMDVELAKI